MIQTNLKEPTFTVVIKMVNNHIDKLYTVFAYNVYLYSTGSHFDDDCPVDWLIPLYMKVPGGGFLFSLYLVWIVTFKCLQDMTLPWTVAIVLGIFGFVWQLIGKHMISISIDNPCF